MDNERRQQILQHNIARRIMRNDSDPFALDDAQFVQTFRLTKEMVQYLMNALIPHMTESFHLTAVTPSIQIFSALNFYATGSYQRAVGQNYMLSISQRSVCNYIHHVSTLIVEHLANIWIVFPRTINEKLRIKSRFMELSRFPGTIGAIDCTHVAILCPTDEEHNYFNRKGYHSKNVQIICDADLKILNINARYAGAIHDAYIWRRSIIRQELDRCFQEGDQNSWLLGDSGYPQEPWLMTPVLNAVVGTPEERYSTRHASTRSCIERCNAVLKTRFRCIMGERKLRYSPEKASNIINACAVLHNICMDGRLPITNDILVPNEDEEVNGIGNGGNQHGRDARQRLIERYFN